MINNNNTSNQQLELKFNNERTCFIHLPKSFIDNGHISVVKLSWRSADKGLLSAYAGAYTTCKRGCIQIPTEFANCLKLEEGSLIHVERVPNSSVYNLNYNMSIERIFVEPIDVDDSEVLEYNPLNAEEHLMHQIRVVYPGLIFPLWIHDVRIFVRVVSCGEDPSINKLPSTVVLLKEGTELIVKTKMRDVEDMKKWQKVKLLLDNSNIDSRTIHISKLLADELGLETGTVIQLLHVIRVRINPSAEEQQKQQQEQALMPQLKEFEEMKKRRSVYGRIVVTNDLEKNMVKAGLHIIQQLGATAYSTVFIRYCNHNARNNDISSMHVRLIIDENNSTDLLLTAVEFQRHLKEWIEKHRLSDTFPAIPMCQQNIIELRNNMKCLLSINEPIRRSEETNSFDSFVQADSNDNLYMLDTNNPLIKENADRAPIYTSGDSIQIKIRPDPYLSYPSFLSENTESLPDTTKKSLERIAIQFSPYRKLREDYSYHYSSIHHLAITGQAGMGKTYFAEALSRFANVYTVYIPCNNMAGDRTDTIILKLKSYFSEAMSHSPSIIIMDDLDVICPFEQEEMLPDPNIKVLSTVFIDHVARLSLYSASVDSKDPFEKTVAVIATCKSMDTLNKKIQSANIFETIIHMAVPDRKQRAKIFDSIMKRPSLHPYTISKDTAEIIVARTENYSPGDLENIIIKMMNTNMIRRLKQQDFILKESDTIELTLEDFEIASQDFVTKSIEGIKLVKSNARFSDIGGLEDVKQILRETFEFPTKYSKYFESSPIKLRSGLLLYGPPGTGKTFLANAVAGECGLNFISVKGPELLNKYIGASEQAVREVFRQADAAKPCIIFFDEFDSIAAKRGHDNTGVTDRVVNQFLTQLDGVESRQGVYVLAATSRPDLIDAALLRPGRLDKAIMCPLPDEKARESILIAHSRDYYLANDVSLKELAQLTEHYTGADLQGLLYTASLIALRERQEQQEKQTSHLQHTITSNTLYKLIHNSKRSSKSKVSEEAAVTQNNEEISQQVENIVQSLKAKELPHGTSDQDGSEENRVVITRDHMLKALNQTMPSLNAQEREKYEIIYENFLNPTPPDRQYEQRVTLA